MWRFLRRIALAKTVSGFKFAMKTLSGGRIGIASQALGIAAGAYELWDYSKIRKALARKYATTKPLPSNWPTCLPKSKLPAIWWWKLLGIRTKEIITTSIRAMAKLCFTNRHERNGGSGTDTRRKWVCEGIPCRAFDARCQNHPNLRRHQRDPEDLISRAFKGINWFFKIWKTPVSLRVFISEVLLRNKTLKF